VAAIQVPEALAERLGERGTDGLIRLLGSTGQQWTDSVLTMAGERYERRLTQEISGLKVEFSRDIGQLRAETAEQIGKLRAETAEQIGMLRAETTEQIGKLRAETTEQIGQLRGDIGLFRADVTRELAASRVDQFKWSFAFWLGQVATTAGLLAYMLRAQ
jgi:hypothetical protein